MFELVLPQQDLDKYHLSPDDRKYRVVPVGRIGTGSRSGKKIEMDIHIPRVCPKHIFKDVRECQWSSVRGPGYPQHPYNQSVPLWVHWRRMAMLNARWVKRSKQEDKRAYYAAEGNLTLWTADGDRVRVWFPDHCSVGDCKPGWPCEHPGRKVLIQKVVSK
jgi:hypothetical protein